MTTKRKVAYASFWSVATVVLVTLLRLGHSVVASRVLEPSDFGIIAFVFSMNALLNQLSFFGVDAALVQKKNCEAGDLDLVWTFEFIRKNLLVLILLLATPFLKYWVDDPRIYWAAPLVAVGMFIISFRNFGIVIFRRQLSFRQIFCLDFFSMLFRVLFIVCGLWLWPNVAIVLMGWVIFAIAQVLLSYKLHEHRPRFLWDWVRLKGLLAFGSCLLGNTIVQLIQKQGVTFALARFAGTTLLGFFNRGRAFSAALFWQANRIIWRVGFPLFSRKHHSPSGLAGAYRSLSAMLFFCVPAVIGCYWVAAPDIIPWLISPKWNDAIIYVQLFCVESLFILLLAPATISFQAIGKPFYVTARRAVACVIFLVLIYPAVSRFGVKGIIVALIASRAIMTPFYILQVRRCVVSFRFSSILRWILPPLVSGACLWFVYRWVCSQTGYPVSRIFLGGGLSLLAYLVSYFAVATILAKGQLKSIFEMFPEIWTQRLNRVFQLS